MKKVRLSEMFDKILEFLFKDILAPPYPLSGGSIEHLTDKNLKNPFVEEDGET